MFLCKPFGRKDSVELGLNDIRAILNIVKAGTQCSFREDKIVGLFLANEEGDCTVTAFMDGPPQVQVVDIAPQTYTLIALWLLGDAELPENGIIIVKR